MISSKKSWGCQRQKKHRWRTAEDLVHLFWAGFEVLPWSCSHNFIKLYLSLQECPSIETHHVHTMILTWQCCCYSERNIDLITSHSHTSTMDHEVVCAHRASHVSSRQIHFSSNMSQLVVGIWTSGVDARWPSPDLNWFQVIWPQIPGNEFHRGKYLRSDWCHYNYNGNSTVS